jgi:outer membrane receptor protein involved in Fe transport
MAEQYYSSTNVAPRNAFVLLFPNSPGTTLAGINGLKPEKSENVSLGVVLRPSTKMTLTFNVYQIEWIEIGCSNFRKFAEMGLVDWSVAANYN